MSEQHHVDAEPDLTEQEEAAGQLGATIISLGLFVVMVVFLIGCWQLGWFG